MSFFILAKSLTRDVLVTLAKRLDVTIDVKVKGRVESIRVSFPTDKVGNKIMLPMGVAASVEDFIDLPKIIIDVSRNKRLEPFAPFLTRPEQLLFLEPLLKDSFALVAQAWDLKPSFGKTFIALYAVAWYGLETTIVVHRLDIADIWRAGIKRFGLLNTSVVMIGALKKSKNIDVLIVDEAHACCTKNGVEAIMSKHPRVLIGLSGTFYKNDVFGPYLDWFYGPRIKLEGDAKEIYDQRRTGKIIVEQIFTGIRPRPTKIWGDFLDSLARNEERNRTICDVVSQKVFEGRVIILFVKTIVHGNLIRELLEEKHVEAKCRFATDKCPESFQCLITTFSKMGTGVSDERIDCCVFAIDVVEKVLQYVYRASRNEKRDAFLIDFVDESKCLKRHAEERKNVYLEAGFEFV